MGSHLHEQLRKVGRRLLYNELPLGGVRFVLMVLLTVFSIVSGGLCLKIWTKHHHWQKVLNENLPPGVAVVLGYSDVRTTSIALFVANQLVTFTASHTVIIMLHDLFKIIPESALRRFRLQLPQKPLSSVTLLHQTTALLVSTVFLIVAGAFHVDFVFSRSGTVSVRPGSTEISPASLQDALAKLGIALPYRDTQYIRVSAELAIPTMLFAALATITTVAAWIQYRQTPGVVGVGGDAGSDSVQDDKSSKENGVEVVSLPVV